MSDDDSLARLIFDAMGPGNAGELVARERVAGDVAAAVRGWLAGDA